MSGVVGAPKDVGVRERAIDPAGSFLVQAPAGSGKTELLIQRYLRLLSVVGEPEEILAITFTRKAAGEMRARIEGALRAARAGAEPDQPHLLLGYRLARAVIARDRECNWGLHAQPARLRIGTIDSVNSRLSRRSPLMAGITSAHAIVEDTGPIFREAARRTIAMAEDEGEHGAALTSLLAHVDNRADRLETLFTTMLQRRDHWLRQIGSGHIDDEAELRRYMTTALTRLLESIVQAAAVALPGNLVADVVPTMRAAAAAIAMREPESALVAWSEQTALPPATIEHLAQWRVLASVFMIDKGKKWRSTFGNAQGFLNGEKQRKDDAKALAGRLAAVPGLREAWAALIELPDAHYSESQWRALTALIQVLPITIVKLREVFAERGETDFSEIAQEGLAALGPEDEATDLRLMLDYQIKHILLDEFQDTSRSQYDLIHALTAGWESEPDRSLFLVGDPMQSIYRFREAEVGLFLDTKQHGIGGLQLEFLRLETNFRSDPAIVGWFNRVFEQLLPQAEDRFAGAVSFAPSVPHLQAEDEAGVTWHVVPKGDREREATRVVTLVRDTLEQFPQDTIGILVRSRSHAADIVRQLHGAGIGFVAPDLEELEEQSVVQDLLALTRALTHVGDRLAWLACLRAPWCGLSLAELHAIAAPDLEACVWQRINDADVAASLAPDTLDRLDRCARALGAGMARRGAGPLRDVVENTWLELGGPATVLEEADLEVAQSFFDFLGSMEAGGDCLDGGELRERLAKRPITRAGGDARVQIMTMHKAKGLEFDAVILPALGATTRTSDKPPLLFHELTTTDADEPIVVAPIKAATDKQDEIYELLWKYQQRKDELERDRLLYVAVTRARRRLHLFAGLALDPKDETRVKAPDTGSLLQRLWPIVGAESGADSATDLPVRTRTDSWVREPNWAEVSLRHPAAGWRVPEAPASFGTVHRSDDEPRRADVEFEWATQWAMHVGSVVHRWLQQIAEEGVEAWNAERVARLGPELTRMLRRLGTTTGQLEQSVRRAADALTRTLVDERGRWVLSGQHRDIANELPVITDEGERFASNIIDRTFVSEDGVRWIVDYKTGSHEGSKLADFLASETERYRPQLRRYRDAFAELEDRPIGTALYFPLLQVFHEIDCDA